MKKKIVYMGTPAYAQVILRALLDASDMEVVLVITQPDKPVGRKRVLTPPPVKVLAEESGIKVLQPLHLKQDEVRERISEAEPDFIVVAAFGQILPESILDIAPCINLHASLLPQYRGASPVQQSLLNGDEYSGVTSMMMERGLDSGPILGYSYFRIPADMRLYGLMDRLSMDASVLTLDTIRRYEDIEAIDQIKADASYCKKIRRVDGEIVFDDALLLYNKYRAFEGWPGIFTSKGLKIIKMKLLEGSTLHRMGEIMDIVGESLVLGCGKGSVRIDQLQPPSKKAMSAKSYLMGRGLKIGDILI